MSARARPGREVVAHLPPAWIASVPVRRWMRHPVVTIGAETPVHEAAALMRERAIRHLPVLEAGGRLAGIVTDRDLRQVLFDVAIGRVDEHAARFGAVRVREVMTWGVVTVTPATDLREAVGVMREQRLGALPVVDTAGRVVGILTERDLLDALQALLRERTVHPAPAAGVPGGDYDPGIAPATTPGENTAALD